MKRVAVIWFVTGMLVAAGGTFLLMSERGREAVRELTEKFTDTIAQRDRKLADLEKVVEEREKTLLGYTEYKKYLTAGKKQLSGKTTLLTATVQRDESYIKYMTTSVVGIKSNGAVKVSYKSEYNFGFDLPPDAYDIRATDSGIEVVVGRPKLVGTPAISNLKHEVLTDGLLTDEKLAVIQLQQDASKRVMQQGLDMAKQAAIAALCEKRLIEFLRDFLAKQPGVQFVPQILVVYR